MKIIRQSKDFINALTLWASTQPNIKAIALVGSYARGTFTASSDIDLILLANEPEEYLKNTDWVKLFGSVIKQQIEHYGKVTSLRVWYADGREIEYGMTDPRWAKPPLDEGTRRVIMNGMKVLFERKDLLSPHLKDSHKR